MRARRGVRVAVARWAAVVLVGMAVIGCTSPADDRGPTVDDTGVLDVDRLPVFVVSVDLPAGTDPAAAYADGSIVDGTESRAAFPEDAVVLLDQTIGTITGEPLIAGTILRLSHLVPVVGPPTTAS